MKKVLFVATVVKTHINAFHLPYLKMFKDKGFSTYVAASNDFENNDECVIPNCDCYVDVEFSRSPLSPLNVIAYKKLKALIEKEKFDIIHCHTPVGSVLTRLSVKNSQFKPYVIYTAHGFHFYKGAPIINWIFFYPIEKYLSRYTNTLITINSEDYKCALKFHCLDVRFINGVGVNCESFKFVENEFNLLEEELNLSKTDFILLSVGELTKRKNHELIISCMEDIVKYNKAIKYLICGSGELNNYLQKIINEKNLNENVKLLGFRKDINKIIAFSDLFIFPSKQEGLPVALMEAMAGGLPCIVSNIRGSRDLIDQGKGGFCINNSQEEYIEKIKHLYNNPAEMLAFSTYNRSKIIEFSNETISKEMNKLYDTIINRID
ncbi:MAG: glycosyltransferase family 4 protein [Bacilli bacterium]